MAVQEEIAESSPHLLSDFTPPFLGAPANSGLMRRSVVTPPHVNFYYLSYLFTLFVRYLSRGLAIPSLVQSSNPLSRAREHGRGARV